MYARLLGAPRRPWAGALLACCALMLTAGCGPDYKSRGVVKGKVTRAKKPLTTGTVMFYGKNGMTASASIDGDGNYSMTDAPLGECRVTVTVQGLPADPSVRARLQGKGPKMPEGPHDPAKAGAEMPAATRVPREVVPIDSKYSDPESSGLSFTVKKGEQTYDIDL